MTATVERPGALRSEVGLEGAYANIATRASAFLLDVVVIVAVFAVVGAVLEWTLGLFLGHTVNLSDSRPVYLTLLVVWAVFALAYPLAVAGRTVGMAVLGLRAVRADGRDLGTGAAVVRTLALPLSFLAFCAGFALIVLRRDHRALHDLIARSAIVYSWQARAAHLQFLVRDASRLRPSAD